MSSDYIKQLEEANDTLRSRLEQFESRCEWLEKLRLLKATSCWCGNSTYKVGINNYSTPHLGAYEVFRLPDDKKIAYVMDYINEEIVRYHVFSASYFNKTYMKNKYDIWRNSIISFMTYAKTVFDDPEYSSINKLSLTSSVHLSLIRLSAEDKAIEAFDNPEHEKDIMQGLTLVIRRAEKLPTVNIVLKKNIDGFRNNTKFMKFDIHVRGLRKIYQAIEDLKKAKDDYDKLYDRDSDV